MRVSKQTMPAFSTLDELCEEIWITKNKSKASLVIEIYSEKLSPYGFNLLCEIIFGPEKILIYEEEKFSNMKKIHNFLDKILKRFIY